MPEAKELITKGASEVRNFYFDFTAREEIADDSETLTGTPTVTAVTGTGLTIGTPTIDATSKKVVVQLSSGTTGVYYTLKCTATTSGGKTLTMLGNLYVVTA